MPIQIPSEQINGKELRSHYFITSSTLVRHQTFFWDQNPLGGVPKEW